MCYSKEYSSSDGNPEFFRTGEMIQLAACKTSYHMAGGRKAKASAKAKATTKRKSKRSKKSKSKKRRVKRKKI
jgi:hypothetical protein